MNQQQTGIRARSALFTWVAGLAALLLYALLRATGELDAARGAALLQGALFLVLLAWLLPRSAVGPSPDMATRWSAIAVDTALLIYGLGLLPTFFDGALLLLGRQGAGALFPWWLALGLGAQLLSVSLAASALKPVPSFPSLARDVLEEVDPTCLLLARLGPHLDEALLALSRDGRIGCATPAAASLLGVSLEQIPGMPLLEALSFLSPSDAQRILLAVEKSDALEERLGLPLEPRRLLGVTLLPSLDGGAILVIRREKGALAGDSEDSHPERMLALGGVVAGVARELNNPLTGLLGFLQLAEGHEDLPPEARADLDRALEEAERCRGILDNLLSFVSRDRPGARLVDLGHLLQETLGLVERQFSSRGFRFSQELEPRPLRVHASPHRLQQVLINLLNHAFSSVQKSGQRVGVRLSQVGARVRLEISDSGPPLAAEDRARLFEPTPGEEEAHLSLIVARRVVRDHHGTLECLSAEGVGNILLMELPLVREVPTLQGVPGDLAAYLADGLNSPSSRVFVAAIPGSPVERLAESLRSLGHQVEVSSRDLSESSGSWEILFVEAPLAGPWLDSWARKGSRVVVVGSTDRTLPSEALLVPEVDTLSAVLTGL